MTEHESYPEFLARVHRDDVAQGKARHRPGVCAACDEQAKVELSTEREEEK